MKAQTSLSFVFTMNNGLFKTRLIACFILQQVTMDSPVTDKMMLPGGAELIDSPKIYSQLAGFLNATLRILFSDSIKVY